MRLDQYLVEEKIAESRGRAKYYIKSGKVQVNGQEVTKPSYDVKIDDEVACQTSFTYVARSALKLAYAFQMWQFNIQGKVCLDVGASTGGFTEVMLRNDAKKVYALDVGHDQLHKKIKSNDKVVNCEGINIREIPENLFAEKIDFCAIDVSFLSLKNVIPFVGAHLKKGANIVALIKPQFEVGPEFVQEKGLVKNTAAINKSIERVKADAIDHGFAVERVLPVPLKGGKSGNQEYLMWGVYKGKGE